MKTLLHNKVKLLTLIFLTIFISAYSSPKDKYRNSVKKEYKHEYKSLKGACDCYNDSKNKMIAKYGKHQKKINRSKR